MKKSKILIIAVTIVIVVAIVVCWRILGYSEIAELNKNTNFEFKLRSNYDDNEVASRGYEILNWYGSKSYINEENTIDSQGFIEGTIVYVSSFAMNPSCVTGFYTTNKECSIYDICVGSDFSKADRTLKNKGFTSSANDEYEKGVITIRLGSEGNKVTSMRVDLLSTNIL